MWLEVVKECARIDRMVDVFAVEMKAKLQRKAIDGYRGWDDTSDPETLENLWGRLREHVERGDGQEVDIANFAAMIYYHERNRRERKRG